MNVGISEAQRKLALQLAAGIGAFLLVVSLFLTWYSVDYGAAIETAAAAQAEFEELDVAGGDTVDLGDVPTELGFSGWSALEFADAFLLFGAIIATLIALRRRREFAAGSADAPAAPSALMGIGLFLVLLMLVLLFTKAPLLGAVDSGLDLASDIAAITGEPDPSGFVDTSIGIGVIVALVGSLLVLLAGLLDGFIKAVGPAAPPAPTATETRAGPPPTG